MKIGRLSDVLALLQKVFSDRRTLGGIAVLVASWYATKRLRRRTLPAFHSVPGSFFLGVVNQIGPNGRDFAKKLDEWSVKHGQEGVFEISMLGKRQLVICDWTLARHVLSLRPFKVCKPTLYKHVGMGENAGIFFSEGSQWKRERRLMAPAFNRKNVDSYAPAVEKMVDQFLSLLEADAALAAKVNFSHRIVRLTSDVIMRVASGMDQGIQCNPESPIPLDTQKFIDGVATRFLSPVPYWRILGDVDGVDGTKNRLSDAMKKAMVQTAGTAANTILEKLRQAEGDKMSSDELAGNLRVLLVAGTDTTSKALAWAFYFLSKDQGLQARAWNEVKRLPDGVWGPDQLDNARLIQGIWREVLRKKGPAPWDEFETAEPVELAGRVIPPGCEILVNYRHILHTAPELKAALGSDLDEFRPERWIASDGSLVKVPELDALSFGHGQRICLGMRLADFEGLLVLARVLQRFHLQPWDGPELEERTGFVLEPAEDVKIAVTRRQ